MQSTEETIADPAECKKIIKYLAKKFKLSILVKSDVTVRHGYAPVKDKTDGLVQIDVEYFDHPVRLPHYNSVSVWMMYEWRERQPTDEAPDFLSSEADSENDAYVQLVGLLTADEDGAVLTKSGNDDEVICEIPPFSSFAELKMKLDVRG